MSRRLAVLALSALALAACGNGGSDGLRTTGAHLAPAAAASPTVTPAAATGTPSATAAPKPTPTPTPRRTVPRKQAPVVRRSSFGNPAGKAAVPAAAQAVDTRHPDHVIGRGSPAGCTSAAVVKAVAAGGTTTFDCGPKPVTIVLAATAKVRNAKPDVVLDGGGLVTLSGAGKRRILYQNTCDQAQGWTTSHCNDQPHPRLTVQNITLANGNATGQTTDGGGGGAVFVRGGRLKIVNARFTQNRCDGTGPDLGGAAVRVLDQSGGLPVYVVRSTFEHGVCSNGGGLSSIGVSWTVLNSLFRDNDAVGRGANPAKGGTPGGGSGGAIYTDGNTYTVSLAGTRIEDNHANEGGGAIFYVSNDHSGTLRISSSTLRRNPSDGFETAGYPGIFYLGKGTHPTVS